MRSPVYWAFLGLIVERADYGYALGLRFERELGCYLALSTLSHVYSALRVLEGHRYIEVVRKGRGDLRNDRQPKPVYGDTPEGEAAYCQWLVDQVHSVHRLTALAMRELAALKDRPRLALDVLDRWEAVLTSDAARGGSPGAVGGYGDATATLSTRLVAAENRATMEWAQPVIDYARREFRARADALRPATESPSRRLAPGLCGRGDQARFGQRIGAAAQMPAGDRA